MKNKEIERKFLVNKALLPDLHDFKCKEIVQGYLSHRRDKLTVRVRGTDDEYFAIEIKDGGGLTRTELSYTISKEEYENVLALCGDRVIIKKRYLIPSEKNNNKILEVDVYQDFDFITCEYEGESEEDVNSLVWEDWFKEELTDKMEYSNRSLAYSRDKKQLII